MRTSLPEDASASATIHADLEVQFAGQTAKYKLVPFEQAKQGTETKISGAIPATLSDFKIDPPSLLTIAVKNEIRVRVEMTWRRDTSRSQTGLDGVEDIVAQAVFLRGQSRYEQALKLLRQALQDGPTNLVLLNSYAVLLLSQQQREEANNL